MGVFVLDADSDASSDLQWRRFLQSPSTLLAAARGGDGQTVDAAIDAVLGAAGPATAHGKRWLFGQLIDERLALIADQYRVERLMRRDFTGLLQLSDFQQERAYYIVEGFRHYANSRHDPAAFRPALENLLRAEQLDRTDHLVLHRIGMVYLYAGAFSDLHRAEDYLRGAAWFARVDATREAGRLAGLMDGHGAISGTSATGVRAVAAVAACQASIAATANARLAPAVELARRALELDPDSIHSIYQWLRLVVRLGHGVDAGKALYGLLRREPLIGAVVAADPGLKSNHQVQAVLARRASELSGPPRSRAEARVGAESTVATVGGRPDTPPSEPGSLRPGSIFRDGDEMPEMVVVPAGDFLMGGRSRKGYPDFGEAWVSSSETPVHPVSISRPFAAGRHSVTFSQFDKFVREGRYAYSPDDQGWGRDDRPVINVNWHDAWAYCRWLSQRTGRSYRLLSEAEWEYCARAGTSTEFWWGDHEPTAAQANTRDSGCRWSGVSTNPALSFPPNPFGLHDMLGNVEELCADLWHDTYSGAPGDGSAWTENGSSGAHVPLRGGSWNQSSRSARCANRDGYDPALRHATHGFRLARDL